LDVVLLFFFFQAEDGIRDGRVTGVQTCALPICRCRTSARIAPETNSPSATADWPQLANSGCSWLDAQRAASPIASISGGPMTRKDRKSIRLNSSHPSISYAVFCLKKKKNNHSIA